MVTPNLDEQIAAITRLRNEALATEDSRRAAYRMARDQAHLAPRRQPDRGEQSEPSAPMLITRSAANIEPRVVEWLWPGWLPVGMLTLFAGHGGGGKSTVALGITAAVSTGGPLPDGQAAPLGNVLYIAGEDTPEYTLVPKLNAQRADLARVHIVDGIRQPGQNDPGWVQVREHIAHIETEIRRLNVKLLVIDPISSFIGDANGDRESDVRSALAPLGKMAERTGCAVLLIRHVSKAGGDPHRASSRILGSTAWHDLPRVAWMLGEAPDDQQPEPHEDGTRDSVRILGVVKSNIATKPAPRWFVQPVDGPMRWLEGIAPVGIDECFRPPSEPATPGKVAEAAAWLSNYLAGGSKPATVLFDDAKQAGHSKATVRRAKEYLRVRPDKLSGDGRWFWRLPHGEPNEGAQDVQGVQDENVTDGAHLGEVTEDAHFSPQAQDEHIEHLKRLGPMKPDELEWEGEEV